MSENKKDTYMVTTTFQTVEHINNPRFEMRIEKAQKIPNPRKPKEIFRFVLESEEKIAYSEWLEESDINVIEGKAARIADRQKTLAKKADILLSDEETGRSTSYICLNGQDGERLPYRKNKSCKLVHGKGSPRIIGLGKHNKNGGPGTAGNKKYGGIFPIIKVGKSWTGIVTFMYRGIEFTIERK